MSVSNKTNYNKSKEYWKINNNENKKNNNNNNNNKNLSVATNIQYCLPQLAYVKIPLN